VPPGSTLAIVLELTRIAEPDDPHAFRFEPQGYTLRGPTGGLERFDIPWSPELLADLDALRRPGRDPAVVQRVGGVMQRALRPIGWAGLGAQIRAASEAGRPVVVTLRSNAAELYALPWELLTVGASGQHLGELAGVLLRHEWPATATSPEAPAPRPEGGRVLLAWSAAGGAVPAAEHQRALTSAWSEGHVGFDSAGDVLAHASPARLADALAAAESAGKPFSVLHLLAHGGVAGSTFGLALDGEDGQTSIVDAGGLRQLLAPHAATLRLVVLAACDGGNTGALGNHLGSVAQALHRAGIRSVVASRYPLSVAGSIVLAEALYHALLVDLHPLEHACTLTRARLARRAEHLDWASLQLYARAADGDDTRPVVFCPYRGLLVFEARHRRFFFGRDAERRETLGDMQALIDGDRPRFLVVVGASGTGKSSMVLAGVVPDIAQLKARSEGPWQVLRMVPGAAPLATLRDLLGRRTDSPLLLVVDQLEELFTHTTDPAARAAFVRELWSLSGADTGLHVIVTLRVDFLGHCGELLVDDTGLSLDRVAYDEAHRVFVARMAPEQIRTAIERPAACVGLAFGAGLLERILADVGAEPGALPLLQYALGRLWEQRRGHILAAEVYEAIGGLVGALEKDADDLIKSLDGEQRKHARRLLTQLVDTRDDETVDTRRRVETSGLQRTDAGRRATFDAVLTRLVDARLVVQSGERGTQTLEIAHEALIRRWGILRDWIREDRVLLLELEKLRAWARDFAENKTLLIGTRLDRAGEFVRQYPDDIDEPVRQLVQASEDERQRLAAASAAQRRRRRNTIVVVISVLVVAVLGTTSVSIYALQQRARADELLTTAKGITEELLVAVLPRYADIPGTFDVQIELHARLQTMLKTLRAGAAQDPEVLHLDIEQNLKRGRLAMTHERLDLARLEFEQALAIAEEWAKVDPTSVQAQRDLSASLSRLGQVEMQVGDLAAARTTVARALSLTEAVAAAHPTSAQAQRDLYVCLHALGEVEQEAGNFAASDIAFSRALSIAEAVAAAHPTSAQAQRDLSVSLSKLGSVEQFAGDLAAARTAFARALNILEALATADPTSIEAQRDLSIALTALGGGGAGSERPRCRAHRLRARPRHQ
jgi:tetratricopeptide (TPR) repeat protein